MTANREARDGWKLSQIITGLVLSAAGIAVTRNAWQDIIRIATRDEESSHILLVPIVAAWLFWVRRGRLRQCRPTGTLVGPIFVALGWLLYSSGDMYAIQSFWHGGAVIIVVGCLLTALGTDAIRHYAPAFIVLGFFVPVPGLVRQQIALPLQSATASVTHQLLEILGADVGHSGNVLTINGTAVAVAEACNGLRMVFALTLVSFTFAFGTPLRLYVRAVVILASPISAIVCNVIRLTPTVWLYGYHSVSVADSFHSFSGWLMLPIAFFMLMSIVHLLRWALVPVTPYVLAYD